ncbi:MAG: cobalamin B12-binding domain-containing protein [Candidatus Atribacteria bacterium]
MKRVIIFIPRSEFLDSDRVMPALGPLYLKSFVGAHGHYVEVNDEPKAFPIEEIKNFDLVGYSCTTSQAKNAINHCKIIKEIFPDKQTVIGGAHAKYYYEELLQESPFDFIASGDGEYALLKLLGNNTKDRLIR